MNKSFGILILLASVICYSSLITLIKKANQTISPLTTIAISMLVLFTCSFILSIFFENSLSLAFLKHKDSILVLVLVGLINALGFWLAIQAFKYFPVWQQSMFDLLKPVLAGVFAYLILGESLSPRLLVGLLIMGAGLYIAIR